MKRCDGRLVHWGFVAALGLCACGEAESSPGAGGATASGGAASSGAPPGGAGGSAGTVTSGGSAAAGESSTAAGAVNSPSPAVSRSWTWRECGRIRADPALPLGLRGHPILSLDFSEKGNLLVSNDGVAIAWRVTEPFESSEALWKGSAEGAFNTDVSADGRLVAISGDVRLVFDAKDGRSLLEPEEPPMASLDICIGTEFRFSPDGRFVAGKRYGTQIDVYDTATWQRVAQLETHGCGQGIVFSADRITAPEGSFRTLDWSLSGELVQSKAKPGLGAECPVYLEPSSGLETVCCNSCETTIQGVTLRGARHPRFSSEGHWLVSGGTLLHVPTGETRQFDAAATQALFTPEGDVIAGEEGGDLVRFCRRD